MIAPLMKYRRRICQPEPPYAKRASSSLVRLVVVETDARAHVGGATRRESQSLEPKSAGPNAAREASTATIPITRIASRSVASRGKAPDKTIGVQDGFSK